MLYDESLRDATFEQGRSVFLDTYLGTSELALNEASTRSYMTLLLLDKCHVAIKAVVFDELRLTAKLPNPPFH